MTERIERHETVERDDLGRVAAILDEQGGIVARLERDGKGAITGVDRFGPAIATATLDDLAEVRTRLESQLTGVELDVALRQVEIEAKILDGLAGVSLTTAEKLSALESVVDRLTREAVAAQLHPSTRYEADPWG